MLSQSFFPNFGQGPFPQKAGKSPGLKGKWVCLFLKIQEHYLAITLSVIFIYFWS